LEKRDTLGKFWFGEEHNEDYIAERTSSKHNDVEILELLDSILTKEL
jgi:hypothetical protein